MMKFLFFLLLLLIATSICNKVGLDKSFAQTGKTPVDSYKDIVVQISCNFDKNETKDGFGFIVAEQKNMLYIVTAQHVVRSNNPDSITEVVVQFYNDKGNFYNADVLSLAYPSVDLALLQIKTPTENFSFELGDIDPILSKGEKVWFIGRSKEWYTPYNPGFIQNIPIRGTYSVEINSVFTGTSGAPLITEEGIVGMIIEDSGQEIVAIDIKTIHNIVVEEWNKPWGLLVVAKDEWPTKFKELNTAEIQLTDVDDVMIVEINHKEVARAAYGELAPWIPIKEMLQPGQNHIEIVVRNGRYGGCGGTLKIKLNGVLNPEYKWSWFKEENRPAYEVCFQKVKFLDLE